MHSESEELVGTEVFSADDTSRGGQTNGESLSEMVVLIIDGNPFTRAGIRHALMQHQSTRVREILDCDPGKDGEEAVSRIAECSPDVALVDIDFPSLSGLDLTKQIARRFPQTKVVVLSANPGDNVDELFKVIRAGAVGYLTTRGCSPAEMVDSIMRAGRGEFPIVDLVSSRPRVAQRVVSQLRDMGRMGTTSEGMSLSLTPKQVQVLTLVAEGNSNKVIADALGICEQTIKNQLRAILRKIDANDRAHAVYIAVQNGLIPLQSAVVAEHERPSAGRVGSRKESRPA